MGRVVGRVLSRVIHSRHAFAPYDPKPVFKMKPGNLLILLFFVLASLLSNASDGAARPFSAEDFDWREMVPFLFTAAALPGEQGVKAVLENSKVLRVYVSNEVRPQCKPDETPCLAKNDNSMPENDVSKRIDEIVQEGISRRNNKAIVDYTFARKPFPFSEIAAVKSENRSEAYFMLTFSDRNYTAADVQAKYGAPYDTDVVQWYSVFKYRMESPHYTSKAVFEIDPIDGAVLKVSISLKTKKPKKEKNGR
jgi:hypothetical protein